MSVRTTFFLSLLVLASHADASALKEYFLKDIGRVSRIRLDGEYEHGILLKNFPGAEPFNASLKVSLQNNDGVVFIHHFFKLGNTSGKKDTLEMRSACFNRVFSKNCSRYVMEKYEGRDCQNDRVTVSYARRENSAGRFELALTAFTDPPCGERFECENRICVGAELRCDGLDNCGDGSDEKGCNGTRACEDGTDGRGCNSADHCEEGSDETECIELFCILLRMFVAIVWFLTHLLCLLFLLFVCACLIFIFCTICENRYKRRMDRRRTQLA